MNSDTPEADDFESLWPKDGDRLFIELAWAYDAHAVRDPESLIDAFGNGKVFSPKNTHELSPLWERFMCILDEHESAESIGQSAAQRLVAEMREADQR